jgi:hypothetical protein
MINIEIRRGDYYINSISLTNKNENLDFEIDEIYMTCKRNPYTEEILFQKKLSTGEIQKADDGKYSFSILPEDTEKLEYGDYGFDFEIVNENPKIKKTFVGNLKLLDEYTFKVNEGGTNE